MSLFNVDTIVISKPLAEKLKESLLSLISFNQTAYVKNIYISGKGKLMYELIKTCNKLILSSYLLIMDTEKYFDSLVHSFLLCDLENGFGEEVG